MDSIRNNFSRISIANATDDAPQKLKSLKTKVRIVNKLLVINGHCFSALSHFMKSCSVNNKVKSHSK